MKTHLLMIFVFILFTLASPGYGGEHIIFTSGVCNISNPDYYLFSVPSTRYSTGVLIPINTTKAAFDFKINFTYYKSDDLKRWNDGFIYNQYYMTYSNELLIGGDISLFKLIELTPQFGFGFLIEWKELKNGHHIVDYDCSEIFEVSLQIKYPLRYFGVGIMVNYQDDVIYTDEYSNLPWRYNISFLLYF